MLDQKMGNNNYIKAIIFVDLPEILIIQRCIASFGNLRLLAHLCWGREEVFVWILMCFVCLLTLLRPENYQNMPEIDFLLILMEFFENFIISKMLGLLKKNQILL
jgi:hypothetical protein